MCCREPNISLLWSEELSLWYWIYKHLVPTGLNAGITGYPFVARTLESAL